MNHLYLIPDRGREQATLGALFLQAHYNYSCPHTEEFRHISCLQSFTVALCSRFMFILSQCSDKMFWSILYPCNPLFLMPEIGETNVTEGVWICPVTPSDKETVQDPGTDIYPKLRVRDCCLKMFCLHYEYSININIKCFQAWKAWQKLIILFPLRTCIEISPTPRSTDKVCIQAGKSCDSSLSTTDRCVWGMK